MLHDQIQRALSSGAICVSGTKVFMEWSKDEIVRR